MSNDTDLDALWKAGESESESVSRRKREQAEAAARYRQKKRDALNARRRAKYRKNKAFRLAERARARETMARHRAELRAAAPPAPPPPAPEPGFRKDGLPRLPAGRKLMFFAEIPVSGGGLRRVLVYTVGGVAKELSLSVKTVRAYIRMGVVPESLYRDKTVRLYTDDQVRAFRDVLKEVRSKTCAWVGQTKRQTIQMLIQRRWEALLPDGIQT
jgi:hypothetical protein